jgi:magnesium and cobalt transporter
MGVRLSELRQRRVDDIMVPRSDIIAVADDVTPQQLIAVFRETAMTRMPVYHETLDEPVGFIHLKDLALRHGFGTETADFDLKALMRPMLYVPGSMPIFALLQKMRRERCHLALVIDEYGGVDGLVTFEDIVEEIVGEIEDEHDTEDPEPWRQEGPGTWLVQARTELPVFERAIGIDFLTDGRDEEVDTLGGLVTLLAGRVPERGEVIDHPAGHTFEIVEADARLVKRVRVRLAATAPGAVRPRRRAGG